MINQNLSLTGNRIPLFLSQQRATFLQKRFINDYSRILDTPVLVPPTWNKTQYHGALSKIWTQAAKDLSEARNIIIIGYSLPDSDSDSFFRYLYSLGTMGASRIREFIVINPDGKSETRFRDMLGQSIQDRFKFEEETLRDFLIPKQKSAKELLS